jgi:predicted nicotinamide N-methyase
MSCTFQFPKAPEHLLQALHQVIPHCDLQSQQLPNTPISLWLIPPVFPTERLDDEVIQRIWNDTPYWIFCWASGLAMAQWLLAEPEHVKDKVVLDFGAGSGVVAIAAKIAGAKRVICCDIDQVSLAACRENALA